MTAQPDGKPEPLPGTVTTANPCRTCRGVLEFVVGVGWIHAVDPGASAWGSKASLACEKPDPVLWHCTVCHQPRPSSGHLPRIVDAHVAPGRPGERCSGSGRAGLPPPWE